MVKKFHNLLISLIIKPSLEFIPSDNVNNKYISSLSPTALLELEVKEEDGKWVERNDFIGVLATVS